MNKGLIYRFSISLLLTAGLLASGILLQKAGSKLLPDADRGLVPASERGLVPASERGLVPASERGLILDSKQGSPFIDESKGPRIALSKEVWDFGEVEEKKQIIHKIFIKNRGNEDLVIEKSRSSCGCVVGIVKEEIVPPGEQTKLGIAFTGEPEEAGKRVQKYIYIHSNDPSSPIKVIKIIGKVKERIKDKD